MFIFVFDKIGIVDFVKLLFDFGVKLLLMGGIVKFFVDVGLFVIEVVDYMGFLEMFDGCVKMFYLKVYGGIFVCCDLFEYM